MSPKMPSAARAMPTAAKAPSITVQRRGSSSESSNFAARTDSVSGSSGSRERTKPESPRCAAPVPALERTTSFRFLSRFGLN
jgi:hypothetical protein